MTPLNCIASPMSPALGPLPITKSPVYSGVFPGSNIAKTALPSVTNTVSFTGLLEPTAGQSMIFDADLINPKLLSGIEEENVPEFVL